MALTSRTADNIVVTVTDDAALLITAMRGNVEHLGEDGRSTVRQKDVFIKWPITRVRYFLVPVSRQRRQRQNETYESKISNDDGS